MDKVTKKSFLAEWIHVRGKLLNLDPHEGSESRRQKTPLKCHFTVINWCPKIKTWGFTFEKL